MKKTLNVYFYRVRVLRDEGHIGTREGTLQAQWPLEALDEITRMAVEEWKRPLNKIELYETDEHGELVATTTVQQRLDKIMDTHKALNPDGGIARIQERREKRKDEDRRKLAVRIKSNQSKNVEIKPPSGKRKGIIFNEWTWPSACGEYFRAETFMTRSKIL